MSLFLYLYVMEYSWDDMVEKFNNKPHGVLTDNVEQIEFSNENR